MNPPEVESLRSASVTYGLIGAGGFGRQTMPILAEMLNFQRGERERRLVFVAEGDPPSAMVNDYPLLSLDHFLQLEHRRFFNVTIADTRVRARIASVCLDAGVDPLTIRGQHSVFQDGVTLGEGAVFCSFTVVSSNASIGRFFHANHHAYVGHDCKIGDFVTFSPAVGCGGNVVIGDYAFFGAGAMIRPGSTAAPLYIGEGAVVGMGAIVTKDVEPFTTVVGNPARPLVRKAE